MRSSLNSFSQTRTKITFTAYLQDSAFKVQVFQQASIMTWRKLCMINLGQHVAKVASGRLFWLELLGLLESRTCPASPVLLTNKVDSMTPWPISQLLLPAVYHVPIFEASSALGFSSAVSWPLGNSVFLDVSSVDLPSCLAVKSENLKNSCFHISSQVTLVMLAKKKVKRQCSSKRSTKRKATVELPKQDLEQQST